MFENLHKSMNAPRFCAISLGALALTGSQCTEMEEAREAQARGVTVRETAEVVRIAPPSSEAGHNIDGMSFNGFGIDIGSVGRTTRQ